VITRAAAYVLSGVVSVLATQLVHAGEFSVSCSYKNDNLQKCASVISDVVTDKFVAKYPAARYQIFVHSYIFGFTDGGYSAYAVAGVIPRNSGQFPLRTFSSTSINGTSNKFGAVDLAKYELDVYRSAAKSLMEQCEISANCDVYSPREK